MSRTIFDLGFHNGDDTAFYLSRGHNVIAVEANPNLVSAGRERFKNVIASGQLALLNRAISGTIEKVDFFVNIVNSHHSSMNPSFAEHDGNESVKIEVNAITTDKLFHEYGVPYYMKVDIEGQDEVVARNLVGMQNLPQFVSFEIGRTTYPTIFSALHLAGYTEFQLVNQLNNPKRKGYSFSEHSSGFFGEELPKNKWLSFHEAMSRYTAYARLRDLDAEELSLGWIDIHAKL